MDPSWIVCKLKHSGHGKERKILIIFVFKDLNTDPYPILEQSGLDKFLPISQLPARQQGSQSYSGS